MPADILSLSKARKAKARADRERLAETNRVRFGRTKAEKQLVKAEKTLAERKIEAHRIDAKVTPLKPRKDPPDA